MSSTVGNNSAFEGLSLGEKAGAQESYIPGESGYTNHDVDTLVNLFLDTTLSGIRQYPHITSLPRWPLSMLDRYLPTHKKEQRCRPAWQEQVAMRAELIAEHLPQSIADPDAFIDAVVLGLERARARDHDIHSGPGPVLRMSDILDPLVQALYGAGHNDFTVDLTPLGPDAVHEVGFGLAGTPEEPLSASYVCRDGGITGFGNHVSDCRLVFQGDIAWHGFYALHCGRGAFNADLAFLGNDGGAVGFGALSSSFTLKHLHDSGDSLGIMATAEDCSYNVGIEPSESHLYVLKREGFFGRWPGRKGNRLYRTTPSGSSEEVRP